MWPYDKDNELDVYFGGRPDGSAKWEVQNLVYIFPPWKIFIPETNTELKHGIRVNKKVAEDLKSIFDDLWKIYPTQEAIEAVDLHKIGGAYLYRIRRGSGRLSNHARGIAIDIDPVDNPMHKGSIGDMSHTVIDAFTKHGWRWGGTYGDPMHFEAVDNAGFKLFNDVPIKPAIITGLDDWVKIAVPVIKPLEKFMSKKYWDVKQWAIGYGMNANAYPDGTEWTEAYASKMLTDKLTTLAVEVSKLLTKKPTANQGAALLSFAWNVGVGNLAVSTLLKKFNAGDINGAADQFQYWVKATINGERKVLPGLVKHRDIERALFLTK